MLTVLGDVGPWQGRIYLVGGLAPRYLAGRLPEGARAHIGTTDVDLVIGLTIDDETPETYRTLQNNLKKAGLQPSENSFCWTRDVQGVKVRVEFLSETDQVEAGRAFRPKGVDAGSKLGALNVPGALLAPRDFIEYEIEGERLDRGGRSRVRVRVANVLPYVVLKILAFQERHENKDAYDLIFTLLHFGSGPHEAGRSAAGSPVAGHAQAVMALTLLEERFRDIGQDGPTAYAQFLSEPDDDDERARLRMEAVATVREFLRGFREAVGDTP